MLLNPLSPPEDHSTPLSGSDVYNGYGASSTAPTSYNSVGYPTPISNMGLDGRDERGELPEQADFYDSVDEDQDMSDGGAALTMTLSHAEALNAELDLLDAEIMGPDNFNDLHPDEHFPLMPIHGDVDGFFMPTQYTPYHPQDAQQDPMDTTNLPATMSQVSQHLQHIQDGQEHLEEMITDEHGGPTNTSSYPFSFPPSPYHFQAVPGSAGTQQAVQYLSMSDAVSVQSTPPLPLPLPLPVAGNSSLQPQNPQNVPHLSFVDMAWDDNSDADQHEVEDQINLSLGEFLYSWGMSMGRNEDSRRRGRGPVLTALHQQRYLENLEAMRRCDLQGELCDIQRINWSELGVTRLEARQMRRMTYRNYITGSEQWPVSNLPKVDR